jgi:hypothetical protein
MCPFVSRSLYLGAFRTREFASGRRRGSKSSASNKAALYPWFAIAALCTEPVVADSFWSQFFDPKDGKFDVSRMLAKDIGFLPVPILITEPAVGVGGGLAAVFFHENAEDMKRREEAFARGDEDVSGFLPPSTSVLFGAATENGSEILGGAHLGIWRNDSIRYTGVLGWASINLAFYGIGDGGPLEDSPEHFNIEGLFVYQELKFRLWDSDFFAGGIYQYLGANTDFDDSEIPPGVESDEADTNVSQLGLVVGYDSRDNLFSPTRGIKADFEALFADEAIGSDSDFQKYKLSGLFYWGWGKSLDFGLRLDGRIARGDIPFFELPFIDLRGIPAMRYQDQVVAVAELQASYRLNPRWSLVGFGGLGQTAEAIDELGEDGTEKTIGGGFRYLIARRLGLKTGIDIARGPEEWTFYLQVGNAW